MTQLQQFTHLKVFSIRLNDHTMFCFLSNFLKTVHGLMQSRRNNTDALLRKHNLTNRQHQTLNFTSKFKFQIIQIDFAAHEYYQ